jgi:ribonucleoside-triphosphate reductase (thioredoxin)
MKIKRVTKLEKQEKTYDIEVDNTHSYQLSNGMVSHNTVSLLTGTSSGIHPRYSRYYIRRVRQDEKDPLTRVMIDAGVPHIKDGTKYIFSFYLKSPEHSVLQSEIGAIKQLELWKKYAIHWADGNPSQTIYYNDNEFLEVASWVWKNWNNVGGLSFFPKEDNVYDNAPLEEISEDQYNKNMETFPEVIDWSKLAQYEVMDNTTGSQTIACGGGQCDLI